MKTLPDTSGGFKAAKKPTPKAAPAPKPAAAPAPPPAAAPAPPPAYAATPSGGYAPPPQAAATQGLICSRSSSFLSPKGSQ